MKTTTTQRQTCPTCHGSRVQPQQRGRWIGGGTNGYRSTTDLITIRYQCPTCTGLGTVACLHCLDRGEYAVSDAYGHHDGIEYCTCTAGHRLREADSIDAVKAAHEAGRPDYIAHSHDRIAAGESPF